MARPYRGKIEAPGKHGLRERGVKIGANVDRRGWMGTGCVQKGTATFRINYEE